MTSLNQSNIANHSSLATGCWQSLVVWEYYFLVDEHGLDAIHLLFGKSDAWWWPQCLIHLLLFASSSARFSNVYAPLQQGRVLFSVRSHCSPIILHFS